MLPHRLIYTYTPEATEMFGLFFGRRLKAHTIVALFGELGAGKTTFLKGAIRGYAGIPADQVTSPTFTYLHEYPGIAHFDLYRLPSSQEFLAMGFHEYFQDERICFLEWPERIEAILPAHALRIRLNHEGGDRRSISIPL